MRPHFDEIDARLRSECEAARKKALEDGHDDQEIDEMIDDAGDAAAWALQWLFDPGAISPDAGYEVVASDVEQTMW